MTSLAGADTLAGIDLTVAVLTETAVALFRRYPPAPPMISAAKKTMAAPTMPPDDRCSLKVACMEFSFLCVLNSPTIRLISRAADDKRHTLPVPFDTSRPNLGRLQT